MASPIEEKFVKDNLSGSSVFEFGCAPGRFATDLVGNGYQVFGVDLYDPEIKGGYMFCQGDFIDMVFKSEFDNVIAVSAIEHCGIESADFCSGDNRNLDYHISVAAKLSRMVTKNNQLIVTVPFGHTNIYYVDKNGNNGTKDEIQNPAWGYRTFTVQTISRLFGSLKLQKHVAYGKYGDDYFNINSWKVVDSDSHFCYDNKKRAVLCCVFVK